MSSVHFIQNQPIQFGFQAETCANNDNRAYCRLIEDGDVIRSYFKRTRGTALSACDFLDVSSTQLLTNSGFTGSAASWTLGGGWSYGANAVSIAASSGSVTQTFASMVDNAMYKIVVTTTATSTGPLEVRLSNVAIGTIPTNSPAAAYSFYGVANTSFTSDVAVVASTTTITVTSIEMYRAAECFTFDVTDGTISYSETEGLTIDGTVTIYVTLPFEPSAYYSPQTTATISGYQTGTITLVYGAASSAALQGSNGEFTYTLNDASYDTLEITFTDFTGNIDDLTFVQLSSDYYVGLFDIDGVFVQNMNQYLSYNREWGYIVFDPELIGMTHGCYKLGFYDPFLHQSDNSIFTYEYDYTTLGVAWTEDLGASWALSAGNGYRFTANSLNGQYIQKTDAVASGTAMIVKFQVEFWQNSMNGPATFSQVVRGSAGTLSENHTGTIDDDIFNDTNFLDPTETYQTGHVQEILINASGASSGTVDIKNATWIIHNYNIDYYSTCFNYQSNHACTKLIYALPGENLGFGPGTQIHFRTRVVKITPTYKISPSSDFISSDSTRTLISGTGQKVYTLLFDYMDEVSHDVVQTIILSQQIYIADTVDALAFVTQYKRYFALPQDYTPEWDKDGKLNLAMGRIQLIEYDQVKFTTNCGN